VCFIAFALVFNYIGIRIKKYGDPQRSKRYEAQSDLTKHLVRIIMTKNAILESYKSETETAKIINRNTQVKHAHKHLRRTEHIGVNMSVILPFVLNVLFLYIGGRFVFDHQLTLGEFVGISTLLTYLSELMREMGARFEDILKNTVAVKKLRSLIDDTPQISGYDSGKSFVYAHGDIVFGDVVYSYNPNAVVFSSLSLSLQ